MEKIVYYCAHSCSALKRIEFKQNAELEDVHYKKKKKGGVGGDLELPRNTGFKSIDIKTFPQFKNAEMFYTWILRGSCDTLVELDLTHNRDIPLQQKLLACVVTSHSLKVLKVEMVPMNLYEFTGLDELVIECRSFEKGTDHS